jgi:acetoin utilization deacetylase AcuC-like enzyme
VLFRKVKTAGAIMTAGFVYSPIFLNHVADGYHPERPERLDALRRGLERADVWTRSFRPAVREATLEELERVHDPRYVANTLGALKSTGFGNLDADTFFSPGSFSAALNAAGGGVDLAHAVHMRDVEWGWSIARPPGHHAGRRSAAGFCIFNNIAIAAASLIASGAARRVAIFDWDVHHGNGTQEQFWDDPNVLFVSIHQWPHYPGSGLSHEIGGTKALGRTINFPFPAGCGDGDYLSVIDSVLAPLLRCHAPDHILVSAGFDAHERDPLGGMRVTTEGFRAMASRLHALASELCGGRLTLFLEGGYDLQALSESAYAVSCALERGECGGIEERGSRGARRIMNATIDAIKPHWPESVLRILDC